jgi:hypothetical protein
MLKFLYWKLIPETRYLDGEGKFEEYSQRTNKLCIISLYKTHRVINYFDQEYANFGDTELTWKEWH